MKDVTEDSSSLPEKPKKKRSRMIKDKTASLEVPAVPAEEAPMEPMDEAVKQTLSNIVQNSVDKYIEPAYKDPYKEQRDDFQHLQPIISEFLDDFILIGHTLDGQRVVIRYTKTPADLDKLTELFRRVFMRMMAQDQP